MTDNKKIFTMIWSIFMLAIYFGMAVMLIFTNFFDFKIELRILFGVCFFIYGAARAYRIYTFRKR